MRPGCSFARFPLDHPAAPGRAKAPVGRAANCVAEPARRSGYDLGQRAASALAFPARPFCRGGLSLFRSAAPGLLVGTSWNAGPFLRRLSAWAAWLAGGENGPGEKQRLGWIVMRKGINVFWSLHESASRRSKRVLMPQLEDVRTMRINPPSG